jgi:RNA 2',3'-cyclic 3'-phosphodiesterase
MTGNAFLAIDLSEGERHALSAALAEASPGHPLPGKRPPPENWHITLRFLGDLDDLSLDRLAREVADTIEERPGRAICSGLGAFPRASRAGVLFAAIIDRDDRLARLAAQCEVAAREAGLEPDERPFVPHLTLSRVRPMVDVRILISSFEPFSVPIAVGEVALMRGNRLRGVVRYETLERFGLA